MTTRKNRISMIHSLLTNLVILAMVSYSVSTFWQGGADSIGAESFRYFTNLSNIFAALMSLVCIPYTVKGIIRGERRMPRPITIIKYTGTVAVTVTMVTVLLFLAPTQGASLIYDGVLLYLHTLVPLLSLLAFCYFERGDGLSFKASFFGIIPVVLYGVLYTVMVVAVKKWEDFYGFTFGGRLWVAPIAFAVMLLAAFGLSVGTRALRNLFADKPSDSLEPETAEAVIQS